MGNEEQQRLERLTRSRLFAEAKRRTAISGIRAIHALSVRAVNEPAIVSEFLIAANDLEGQWAQFKSEDESVLEHLINLDKPNEYSADLPTEVRALITASRSVVEKLTPKGAEAIDLSYLKNNLTSSVTPNNLPAQTKQFSRLPDIPLPQFDGDYRYWPTFCNAFEALVETRPNICDIDKLNYLIGCLKGRTADAVRGIPLSAENYALVRSTLSERFYRPRLVATSLIDKLLGASPIKQESLSELNSFMCEFSENISLLNALKIPPKEKLAVCLRFLGTGDSYQTIAFSFRLGHSTVQSIVLEVCSAIILKLKDEYISIPGEEDWKRIAKEFWKIWNFPNCIGALDGKHVVIEAPPNSGSLYFNYKKTFSIVLLALVDAQYKFLAVDIGAYGKIVMVESSQIQIWEKL